MNPRLGRGTMLKSKTRQGRRVFRDSLMVNGIIFQNSDLIATLKYCKSPAMSFVGERNPGTHIYINGSGLSDIVTYIRLTTAYIRQGPFIFEVNE